MRGFVDTSSPISELISANQNHTMVKFEQGIDTRYTAATEVGGERAHQVYTTFLYIFFFY
jgi:hypothetical protein